MSKVAAGVAEVWSEVLQAPAPGDADDFFVSGGDSVRAMVMTFSLGEKFGVDLTPEAVFEAPTFGALCALIERQLTQPAV